MKSKKLSCWTPYNYVYHNGTYFFMDFTRGLIEFDSLLNELSFTYEASST